MGATYAYDPDGRWRVRVKAFKNDWGVYHEIGGNIRTQARIGRSWKDHSVTELSLTVFVYATPRVSWGWGPLESLPFPEADAHVDWLQIKFSSSGAWLAKTFKGVTYRIRGVTAAGLMKVGGDVVHVGPVSDGLVSR
jgi:hypothetical protein